MRAEGRVLRVGKNSAEVEVIQRSACSGCSEGCAAGAGKSGGCGYGAESGAGGSGCAGCHKAVRHVLTLKNDVGAQVGDLVYIESNSGVIFALCAILFLLPLLAAGALYAAFWGWKDSGTGALAAFVTALSSFALLYLTAGKRLVKRCEYRMVTCKTPGMQDGRNNQDEWKTGLK